jgi:F-type H+-transporting ATPase subunit epsilon
MITFELVSPEKKLFSAPVAMVTLPGSEGDFGVLEGHAPFISTMRVGLIEIYAQDGAGVSQRILVSGGLVEVNPERCTVLAEEAVPMEEVTKEGLEAELKKQQDLVQVAADDDAREKIQEKIALVNAKLVAVAGISAAGAH